PYGIVERERAFERIARVAENNAVALGLTPAEVLRIKAIAEEYSFAVTIYEQNRVTMKALRAWRDAVISNEPPIEPYIERPMFNNTAMPVGTQRGLVAEMRQYVRRMKASGGFSAAIGRSMGVLAPNHAKKPLGELQPQLKATAVEGFKVTIACEMQGMTGIQVEFRRNGEEKFEKVAFLTKLPETIYIEPRVLGVPETGYMRAIYFHKNKTVGQYSAMVSVTLFAM
ncbi:MAG: hypothetical protein ABL959_23180, partial [Pyrinomonadaceae bacterium]